MSNERWILKSSIAFKGLWDMFFGLVNVIKRLYDRFTAVNGRIYWSNILGSKTPKDEKRYTKMNHHHYWYIWLTQNHIVAWALICLILLSKWYTLLKFRSRFYFPHKIRAEIHIIIKPNTLTQQGIFELFSLLELKELFRRFKMSTFSYYNHSVLAGFGVLFPSNALDRSKS